MKFKNLKFLLLIETTFPFVFHVLKKRLLSTIDTFPGILLCLFSFKMGKISTHQSKGVRWSFGIKHIFTNLVYFFSSKNKPCCDAIVQLRKFFNSFLLFSFWQLFLDILSCYELPVFRSAWVVCHLFCLKIDFRLVSNVKHNKIFLL